MKNFELNYVIGSREDEYLVSGKEVKNLGEIFFTHLLKESF